MNELGEERPAGAAGPNNRPFGAEGTAGADRNGSGYGLERSDARADATALQQDHFDGLGYTVPANAFGAVARHQADDQCADDGYRDDQEAESVVRGRCVGGGDALIEKEVGGDVDQLEEKVGKDDADDAGADRERAGEEEAPVSGEITE
jgi:hypothetical protein